MKSPYLILLAAALMCSTNAAAQSTTKLTATKATDYGLIYTLPDVVADVTLEARRTVKSPGEFADYAKKYLKTTPITSRSESWELVSATIVPRGVTNDTERYSIQFKAGTPVSVVLNEIGAPLAINDDGYAPRTTAPALPVAQPAKPTILETPAARQALSEEMMQSTSTAKRAELAAAKIYELRQNRNDIISGNADNMPKDGAAMKIALEALAAQEEALTAMFTGVTSTSTEVAIFTYRPGTDNQRAIIARLSGTEGLVPSTDLSGDPIYVEYSVLTRGTLPLTDRGEERKFPKGGVAYRIPGTASLSISFLGETLAKTKLEVPALGVVFGLDPSIFSDKKAPSYLHFNPLTGGIAEIGAKTDKAPAQQ